MRGKIIDSSTVVECSLQQDPCTDALTFMNFSGLMDNSQGEINFNSSLTSILVFSVIAKLTLYGVKYFIQ